MGKIAVEPGCVGAAAGRAVKVKDAITVISFLSLLSLVRCRRKKKR